jgi:hypothetical protein
MRTVPIVTIVAAACAAIATSPPVSAAPVPQAAVSPLQVLDVPYVSQSEQLCGGAALAMMMRYWGATGVYADTFAPLVDQSGGGIAGEALVDALHARGWIAEAISGTPSVVQAELTSKRPVIALIQDRPGRLHYVVVVAWSNRRVILHDPARAPFRVLDEEVFLDAWRHTGSWTLVASPAPSAAGVDERSTARHDRPTEISARGSSSACRGMVNEGVRLAGRGKVADARRLFESSAETCPDASAPYREIAGLHALQRDWRAAERMARRALALDDSDTHAWRILATSLYLEGDETGALAAWNAIGEPAIDLVRVHGLVRTRYEVVSRVMGLPRGGVLSPGALTAAGRRLSELPSAQATRVTYRPGEAGRARVDAAVVERPLVPLSFLSVAASGVRALTDREIGFAVASPTGGGELASASWRWWDQRPRIDAGIRAPAPFGGVWGVAGFTETQTYVRSAEEHRDGTRLQVSRWTGRGLRWVGELGVDRWRGLGSATAIAIGVQQHVGDAAVIDARSGFWLGGVETWTLALGAAWRSRGSEHRGVWMARGGVELAGAAAPLALWSGAGTGHGRDLLLRAHPLLVDGAIDDGVFGRGMLHGGGEWRRQPHRVSRVLGLSPAVFVDVARARAGLDGFDPRTHVDLGAGLRISMLGEGLLRLDAARGLRDGAWAISAGWTK